MEQKPTRKRGRHLRVPVLLHEEEQIKQQAALAGLTVAEYLRRLGLGYKIHGIMDKQHILKLAKINADLGRLGGLLKLWITQDKRVAHFDFKTIMTLLNQIRHTQEAMLHVVKKL